MISPNQSSISICTGSPEEDADRGGRLARVFGIWIPGTSASSTVDSGSSGIRALPSPPSALGGDGGLERPDIRPFNEIAAPLKNHVTGGATDGAQSADPGATRSEMRLWPDRLEFVTAVGQVPRQTCFGISVGIRIRNISPRRRNIAHGARVMYSGVSRVRIARPGGRMSC